MRTRSLLFVGMITALAAGASDNDFETGLAAYRSDNPAAAFDSWSACAIEGTASCQYGLGVLYDEGLGVARDSKKALEWYERAAAQNYPDALMQLGFLYAVGRAGIDQSPTLAWAWFARAAAAGVPVAADHRDRVAALLTEEELAQAQKLADELSIRYHLQE